MNGQKSLFIAVIALFIATGFSSDIIMNYWRSEVVSASIEQDKQSFCFTKDNQIYGENIDLAIKPASVTKLYTTLWSLDELDKNFRFQTKFIVKGQNLYIMGGSDPYFVTENLLLALSKLNSAGFSQFEYVFFDKNFFYNWKNSPLDIKKKLNKILNKSSWNTAIFKSIQDTNSFFQRQNQPHQIKIQDISAQKIVAAEKIETTGDYSFTFYSSPLWKHFKQVNMYSNNFYTDQIFNYLGGERAFNNYITEKLNASDDEIHFYTGSGLGKNYTTCRTTLKMLDALKTKALDSQLQLEQILAVPGTDAGTMKKRFTSPSYNKKIVAKTGTLNDTSAFAGFILSHDIRFAVFNHTKPYADKKRVRKLQDDIVKKIIDQEPAINSINYMTPDYISVSDIIIKDN